MSVKDAGMNMSKAEADKKKKKTISSFFVKKSSSPNLTTTGGGGDHDGSDRRGGGGLDRRLYNGKSSGDLASPLLSAHNFSFSKRQTTGIIKDKTQDVDASTASDAQQKDATGGFPLLVVLPSGERCVMPCSFDMTTASLLKTLSERTLELSGIPLSDMVITELSAAGASVGPAFPPQGPVSQTGSIPKHLSSATIPTVGVIVTKNAKKDAVATHVDSVINEQEFAAKTFKIQLQLPGGQTLSLECKGNDTIEDVKMQIVPLSLMAHGIDLLSQMEKYTLVIPGVDVDRSINSSVSFIEACRKKSVIPKLVLMEKSSAFTKKEKINNLLIGSLIDKPLCWTVDELEKTTFHQKSSRLHYMRKKSRGATYGIHLNPQAVTEGPPPKILVTVNLPLAQAIKTVVVEGSETADEFKERIFQKNYAKVFPNKSPADFSLKVKGMAEYLYGNYPLYHFDYVWSNLDSKKIELVLIESQINANDTDDGEEFSTQEFFEVEDEGIHYSHSDIETSAHSWEHLTCLSIWELKREFRMRVVCVENLMGRKKEENASSSSSSAQGQLYVTAALYHGGEQQSKATSTQSIDWSNSTPRWYEWISTGTLMYNIPRATRICFTLYEHREDGDIPLAWVNCQLFDYKQELKTGVHELGMWPNAVANPIGTCVGNSAATAPILFVEFEKYPLPIVFPTEPSTRAYSPPGSAVPRNQEHLDIVNRIIMKDPLYPLTTTDKELLWTYREYYKSNPKGLPKFLASVPYNDMLAVHEMHKYLNMWAPIAPRDALELLDSRFADIKVRSHAVKFLEELSDDEFSDCLLQLIQVLKYESYHDSALSRLLLNRALNNIRIGHSFFWFLKSEMHVSEISERYGLLLEAYLRGCGAHMAELQKQNEILKSLVRVANLIKPLKDSDRREVLLQELDKIKFPSRFQLPLNPRLEASGLIISKCKYMDSKKLPLWLVFSNADPHAPPIYVIFKSGDDLRQDMLTLQMIQFMDKLWKQEGLDLRLSPYGCIACGDGVGMIEVVLNADTTANIQKAAGGVSGALKNDPLANWIRTQNPTEEGLRGAVENFVRSCAGYCVATYVLGVGDRHNDNVMITKSGKLFHIDFGHFLGNYKTKFGFKRERAPFKFTPDFAFVMGGKDSSDFNKFIEVCCIAYNIVRKHASVFINLFAMMLSTGIPELTCVDDITYLRDALLLDYTDDKARETFTLLIYESLGTITSVLNDMIHIIAH